MIQGAVGEVVLNDNPLVPLFCRLVHSLLRSSDTEFHSRFISDSVVRNLC
jgi:hypothetical protein